MLGTMRNAGVVNWLVVLAACSGARTAPGGLGVGKPSASGSGAPAAVTAMTTVARSSDHSRLFMVGETARVLPPIAFDNRAFLQLGSGWVEVEGERLVKTTEYLAGLDPTIAVVTGAGRLPERAWVLAGGQEASNIYSWSEGTWHLVTNKGTTQRSADSVVAMGRWGDRHLALCVHSARSGRQRGSYFDVLEGDAPAPEFTPAPAAAGARNCGSQLDAEAGFSMANGDFVAMGTLCGSQPARFALEHFAAAARRGRLFEITAPAGQKVRLQSGAASDKSLFLAGSLDEERPYLARFSGEKGLESLEVPAGVDPIQTIAVSGDGSLWVKAPPRAKKIIFDDDGLWRRSSNGRWQRLTIEPRVPGKPEWSINICGFGLFSLAKDAWLEACYVRQGKGHENEPWIGLLYRSRETSDASAVRP
jgi:hypothetical protein